MYLSRRCWIFLSFLPSSIIFSLNKYFLKCTTGFASKWIHFVLANWPQMSYYREAFMFKLCYIELPNKCNWSNLSQSPRSGIISVRLDPDLLFPLDICQVNEFIEWKLKFCCIFAASQPGARRSECRRVIVYKGTHSARIMTELNTSPRGCGSVGWA